MLRGGLRAPQRTAEVTGGDMSKFPSAKHLAS